MGSLEQFLKPWTIAAITLSPFLFQYLKSFAMRFMPDGSSIPKQGAAVLHTLTVIGVVVWQGHSESWLIIASQAGLAVLLAQFVYVGGVEPMADSSHPLIPKTSKAVPGA